MARVQITLLAVGMCPRAGNLFCRETAQHTEVMLLQTYSGLWNVSVPVIIAPRVVGCTFVLGENGVKAVERNNDLVRRLLSRQVSRR